ncbi:Multidrug resistance protein MdtA [bioreactor metagenome]|uniref:Multidrug resistance protein MdtA n=1 Tax=bioreactor metagenome TaxID=1076179 RepID=A0A645HZ01_9ZZZZ
MRGVIANPDAKLRPGMLLVVTLELGSEQAVMIPEKAVLSLGEIQYVFVLQPDGTVARKEIKPGIRFGGKVEVVSGISTGSKIIVEGVSKLVDNSKVMLAEDLDKSKSAIKGGNGK